MKASKIFASVVLVCAVAVLGCDLGLLAKQAGAKKLVVATLLATPEVELKPHAIAGFDASLPFDAGGLTFDGGFLADAGLTVPAQTTAFVYFGERQGDGLNAPPTAVLGAVVSLKTPAGTSVPVPEVGQGTYIVGGDAGFAYSGGGNYDFTIEHGGATHIAQLANAPNIEKSPELHPSSGYVELNAGASLTITRPNAPTGQERTLAFITVVPIDREGKQGEPTYTNVPKTPLEFLKLVAFPDEWKADTMVIPGTAFPMGAKNYLVIVQAAKLGKATSDNLFVGSAVLGGTADIGVIKTR